MGAPVVVRRNVTVDDVDTYRLFMWCPGCEDLHAIGAQWTWDGNTERPTINPSILVGGVQWPTDDAFHKPRHAVPAGAATVCHSFIRDGRWEFLTDNTHQLAGQTVPMGPVPLDAKGIL